MSNRTINDFRIVKNNRGVFFVEYKETKYYTIKLNLLEFILNGFKHKRIEDSFKWVRVQIWMPFRYEDYEFKTYDEANEYINLEITKDKIEIFEPKEINKDE